MTVPIAGRGPEVLAVYAVFTGLTTITTALRVYCRVFLVKKFAWDDWTAAVAWAIFVGHATCAFLGVQHGTGQHAREIQPQSEIPAGLMWWWMCEPTYVLSNMAIKLSIAIMLLRLTIDCTHRLIIIITIIVTELYWYVRETMAFFFLFVFQCRPSSYFWTQLTGGTGSCMSAQITVNTAYAYSAVTCLGDWIFAILPWKLVWNLQMPQRQKTLVALILSLGAIASTATIIRIPYIHTLNDKADFLYATTDVAIWSCCETGLGIFAANAATLRPLVRSWLQASSSFRSTAARSIARRASTRQSNGRGGRSGGGLIALGEGNVHDVEALKLKISSPKPIPRASIASARSCRWGGGRWGKSVANEDIEALPPFGDREIRKTTDVVMVEESAYAREHHEVLGEHSPADTGRERWRSVSEDSEGSEVKINPQPAPPVPLKGRRERGKQRQNTAGESCDGRTAARRENHCRCNCRALDFEQVRALLEGSWIGSMAAGPSGTRSSSKGNTKGANHG